MGTCTATPPAPKVDSETAPAPPQSAVKPAMKEKREKSTEKEVKFKLPPEEMEDEEEEIEEVEEVEIIRPPTPPKTLSKAKTKSVSRLKCFIIVYCRKDNR